MSSANIAIYSFTKLNCEVLHDDSALEIRWAVVGSGETIVFQMVGRIANNNYMAFGLSGENDRSVMIGSDATVGWFDEPTGRGYVVDYFLDGKYPCNGKRGVCPDTKLQTGTGSNNVRLLSAAVVNGFTILTWQRRLSANDDWDKSVLTNGSQPVIWAVGPLNNQEAAYHTLRNKDDIFIDFGRLPKWNCPAPEPDHAINSSSSNPVPSASSVSNVLAGQATLGQHQQHSAHLDNHSVDSTSAASQQSTYIYKNFSSLWNVPPIQCHEPEDGVFYAQIGPTGGKRGFNTTTGQRSSQSNAWYINGLLLPEIYVVRHKAYTFVVEGGDNPDLPSKYHPFYITDDPEGGFQLKSQLQKKAVKVFAGVSYDESGKSIATTTGRLCQWMENDKQPAESFTSYGAYQRSLSLRCEEGHSGILQFSPDENTPDLVYYQSYSTKYQGWRIHVLDTCDKDKVRTKESLEKSTTPKSVSQRDQDIAESIQQPGNLSLPAINGIKDVVKEDQAKGSPHLVDYLFAAEKPTLTLPDKDSSPASQPILKQQGISPLPVLTVQTPQTLPPPVVGQRQEIQIPIQPETIPLPQPSFQQVPVDLVGGARIPQHVYAPATTSYIPLQQNAPGVPVPQGMPKIQINPTYTILDAYGRRVGETSDPAVIYDNRPAPVEFSLVPPRTQHIPKQQQIVYDQVPQATVFYASTIAPPSKLPSPIPYFENRPNIEYQNPMGSVTQMAHRQGSHVFAIQNLPQQRRPTGQEHLAMSSENIRYIEYPPVHIRLPQTTANWPRSRNLPKRENVPEMRREALSMNRDQLRMNLKRSGSGGMFDVNISNENYRRGFRQNDASRVESNFPAEVYQRMPQRNPHSVNANSSTASEQSGHHFTVNNTTPRKTTPAQVYFAGEEQSQNRSSEPRIEPTNNFNGSDPGNNALSLTLLTDIWQTINQGNKETPYQQHQRFIPPPPPHPSMRNANLPRLKDRLVPNNVNVNHHIFPFRHQRKLFSSSAQDTNTDNNGAEQSKPQGLDYQILEDDAQEENISKIENNPTLHEETTNNT